MSDTKQGTSGKTLIAAAVSLIVLVGVAGALFLMGGSKDVKKEVKEDASEYSFKAYTKSEVAKKEAPEPIKKEVKVDEDLPPELRGLELDDDQEVVVIEEYHEPENTEPAAVKVVENDKTKKPGPGEAYPVEQETFSSRRYMRQRYGSPEQRSMLRQLNQQLDRGEKPVIPKARIPGRLRPVSPQLKGSLDTISGAKFVPGKLHNVNSKPKAIKLK